MITVFKANSIIERNAILHELREHGTEAFSGERDISRKVASSTVDMAFEGVSILFDGFAIQVNEKDKESSEQLIKELLARVNLNVAHPEDGAMSRHLRKFYYCSIFSITIPVAFNIYGFYQMYLGLKNREPVRWGFFIFSLVIMLSSSVLWILVLIGYLSKLPFFSSAF